MLAPSKTTQKPFRASFARVLAHLTIGFGISTGAAMLAGPALSQTCDRCAGLNAPSCGCELARSSRPSPKPCSCTCVPKPSLGEMLLSRLDQMGDRIEAKTKKQCDGRCDQAPMRFTDRGPTCGCESPQNPSCGCESNQMPSTNTPFQYSPSHANSAPPLPGDPSRFAVGSIGDKSIGESRVSSPSGPQATLQIKRRTDTNLSRNIPQELSDVAADPVPTVQRTPFEQRNPTHNRIPAVETTPEPQAIPNSRKAIPSDPPPNWVPDTLKKPPAESSQKLPDVLVDPFKDDARIRGTRQKMEGVLLTSDRQHSNNALRLAPPDQAKENIGGLPSGVETPAMLTPNQRNSERLQFEATDSESSEGSQVVPSSYTVAAPVKVALRKVPSENIPNDMPQVSKIRVPQKR